MSYLRTRASGSVGAYAVLVVCPSCQANVDDGDRFCSTCGHEVARRADERRVVTVLFADIVGFTGLSEDRDPEQVKNLVNRCFALLADDITSFGGRVDKVIGDAIVALFGAPIAHEDDAERAVRAALRMQESVTRYDDDTGMGIRLRIGINTGEVLVGAIAAGDDYTAMGDVVNTASRLQTTAEPGTVVVGPITYEATAEVVHYRSLGQIHARGREEPVAAYRALEPYGRPGERRKRTETPLVGRGAELGVMREAISASFERRRAQLILLAGEAGVGKSRLASEMADLARFDHNAVILQGRCLPYGEANIWWPIAEAISNAIGLTPDVEQGAGRDVCRGMVTRLLVDDPDDNEVERIVEGLAHLLGHESSLGQLDSERATAETMRSIRIVLGLLADKVPVMLWLNDLHWADDAVLRLLDDLLDRLGRRPVVVMGTGTNALFDRWSPRPGRFNSVALSLDPLGTGAMRRLAAALAPELAEADRDELVDRAGGNPLFLEEMARVVASADSPVIDQLPANVRSVIGARLDALDDTARAVIGDAAVLGVRGEVMALHKMAEFTRADADTDFDLDTVLWELERADLLEVTGTVWWFRSNLVREVVYDRLTKTDRAWRHAGIAAWIEAHPHGGAAEAIAHHYRQAAALDADLGGIEELDIDLSGRAIDWTIHAARESSSPASIEHTESLFAIALDLLPEDDPRRVDLLLDRAAIAVRGLELPKATADVEEARVLVEQGADDTQRIRFELVASELAQWSEDHELAMAHARTAFGLARNLDEETLIAESYRRIGMIQLFGGNHQDAERAITKSLAAYEHAEDVGGMAWARQNLAWIAFIEGRMADAEVRLHAASKAFGETGDRAGQAWSSGLLAYVRIYDGRFAEADELARRTLGDAAEAGDAWGQGMMHVALATSALWTGRIDEALEHTAKALSIFPEESDRTGMGQASAVRGRALVRKGLIDDGFALLEAAAVANQGGQQQQLMHTSIAAAAATVGDTQRAQQNFGGLVDHDPDVIGEAERTVAVALTQLQLGDPETAYGLLDALPAPGEHRGSTWGWAVMALTTAVLGKDVAPWVDAVEGSIRSTYADKVLVRCAVAVAAARGGDEAGARVALSRAGEAIPAGGDQLHPAVVQMATSVCLAATAAADTDEAVSAAEASFSALGLDGHGWRTAFRGPTGD